MDKLPPEMLLKIAQNLSPDDLVSLSGANQRIFATIANDKLLWQQQLKEAKFPSCSELKKLIPMDSGNCQEKDEFLLQKRLHQNWKTGNFPLDVNIMTLSCGMPQREQILGTFSGLMLRLTLAFSQPLSVIQSRQVNHLGLFLTGRYHLEDTSFQKFLFETESKILQPF